MTLESRAQALLERAGITVNGNKPWDIQVHNPQLYGRVLRGGTLALGESYMDGWWDAPAVDQLVDRLLSSGAERAVGLRLAQAAASMVHRVYNHQSRTRAFVVGRKHYDKGNELYERMLGCTMTYTCGYWKEAQTLGEAQVAKLNLVCRKIGLKHGMRVLDIGCGWGSFAQYAAERYGASVVGVTISVEQAKLARKRCAGLPVEIRLQDYRDVHEQFDVIVSLGMFEHVGYKNYRTYMEVARRCLRPGGLFLLHAIGGNRSVTSSDPWLGKYIFPNGMLPSIAQIGTAMEGLFVMEDWHNFGADYDPTLMAWNENFQRAWPELREVKDAQGEPKYDERFKRMWEHYLLSCAGLFRSRRANLWQIVLSPHGVRGGYESVR